MAESTQISMVRQNYHKECEAGVNKQINLGKKNLDDLKINENSLFLMENFCFSLQKL